MEEPAEEEKEQKEEEKQQEEKKEYDHSGWCPKCRKQVNVKIVTYLKSDEALVECFECKNQWEVFL